MPETQLEPRADDQGARATTCRLPIPSLLTSVVPVHRSVRRLRVEALGGEGPRARTTNIAR